MQPYLLFSVSLFFLLVRVALKLQAQVAQLRSENGLGLGDTATPSVAAPLPSRAAGPSNGANGSGCSALHQRSSPPF